MNIIAIDTQSDSVNLGILRQVRARICKRLRNPGNRFRQPMWLGAPVRQIGLSFVPARQAGNRFLGSLKGLQIQALASPTVHQKTVGTVSAK
jgi:hypothetical protein